MGKITENNVWHEDIYSIDRNVPVQGGDPEFVGNQPTSGYANAGVKQVADRTRYLKSEIARVDQRIINGTVVSVGTQTQLFAITDLPNYSGGSVNNDPDPTKNGDYWWDQPNSTWVFSGNQRATQSDIQDINNEIQVIEPSNIFSERVIASDYSEYFNFAEIDPKDGYIQNSDGNVGQQSGWKYTAFIKVTPRSRIFRRGFSFGAGAAAAPIACYDSNFGYLGSSGGNSENFIDFIPDNVFSGTTYVRFSYLANSVPMISIQEQFSEIKDTLYRLSGGWANSFAQKTEGSYLRKDNGTVGSNSGWSVTIPIPIEEGDIVSLSGTPLSKTVVAAPIAVFDNSDTYLGYIDPDTMGQEYIITDLYPSASYIRVSRPYESPSDVQIKKSVHRGLIEMLNTSLIHDFSQDSSVTTGRFINASDGSLGSNSNWAVTDFIPAQNGQIFLYTSQLGSAGTAHAAMYDINKNYLGAALTGYASTSTCDNFPVKMNNALVAYARFSFVVSSPYAVVGVKSSASSESQVVTRWTGLPWFAFGDSITAQSICWPYKTAPKLGAILTNKAVSGSRTRQSLATTTAANFAGVKLATINHGTNDFKLNTPLGVIGDAPSFDADSTFYANVKYLIETLLSWEPSVKLMWSTPLQRTQAPGLGPNDIGVYLYQYRDAIVEVCKLYAVEVNDMYYESGLCSQNMDYWTGDGLHPLEIFHEQWYAPRMTQKILSL